MNIYAFLFTAIILLGSTAQAHISLEDEEEVYFPQKKRHLTCFRAENDLDIFLPLEQAVTSPLQRTEGYAYIPVNLHKVKVRQNGNIYLPLTRNYCPLKNIEWEGGPKPSISNSVQISTLQNIIDENSNAHQLSLSSAVPFQELPTDKDAYCCDVACNVFEDFMNRRFTRFYSMFSVPLVRMSSVWGWRLDILLSSVIKECVKENRFVNGHQHQYLPIPTFSPPGLISDPRGMVIQNYKATNCLEAV